MFFGPDTSFFRAINKTYGRTRRFIRALQGVSLREVHNPYMFCAGCSHASTCPNRCNTFSTNCKLYKAWDACYKACEYEMQNEIIRAIKEVLHCS